MTGYENQDDDDDVSDEEYMSRGGGGDALEIFAEKFERWESIYEGSVWRGSG